MNFITRIRLLRRRYSKIRDDEETINEIWKDEEIPFINVMSHNLDASLHPMQ